MSNCTPLRRELPTGWAVLSAPQWKACLQARAHRHGSNHSLPSTGSLGTDYEARFVQIANTLPDVFWIYEPLSGRFLYVSPAYECEWQASASALYADAQAWLALVHEDDRPLLQRAFDRLADGYGYSIEYRVKTRSLSLRWIEECVLPVANGRGLPLQFAGVSRDITARKNEQLALHRSQRSHDELLATVSHELRSPLQPIRLAAALLAQLHVNGPEIESKAISVIERQVRQLSRLVEDLLDDARLTHGKIRLVPELVCLGEVLEAAIDANRTLIETNRLRLQLKAPSESVWLRGDAVRLTQVFSNLLHNAAKFSVAGGTVVIRVDACQADRPVAVSVRDDGIGIAPELIGSVFELFTQQNPSLAPDHGGLGIGLSVVRGLVELHGGTVTAHSAGIGTGSEFIVTLPSATTMAPRGSAPKALLAKAEVEAMA